MPRWIHRLLHNDALDKRLDAELQFHLEQQIAENIAAGMTPEEARRRAQIAIGGVEQVKQKARDVHWENWIENIGRDFRFAIRSLNKDRRFALDGDFCSGTGDWRQHRGIQCFLQSAVQRLRYQGRDRLVVPMRDRAAPSTLRRSFSDIEAIRGAKSCL